MKNSIKKLTVLLLSLAVMPTSMFAADPSKSRIVTYKSNPVKCLASVAINQVDGKGRQLPTMGFELEPGTHTMHGRATIDLRNCPVARDRSRTSVHVPPLDWFFEAGKVYYVALDHSAPSRESWRLVVWKVEDEDGETVFDITEKAPELPN